MARYAVKRLKRLLGHPANPPTKNGALHAFPNFDFGIVPDYFLVQSWLPVGPHKTVFRNTFSVHRDAVESEDYSVDELVALMDVTSREDLEITGRQEVTRSKAYEPGPTTRRLRPAWWNGCGPITTFTRRPTRS